MPEWSNGPDSKSGGLVPSQVQALPSAYFTMIDIIGAIGLLLVSLGVVVKKRILQNILFLVGGFFLELYSLIIGNTVFIVLQLVFILSAFYGIVKG